MHHLNLIHEHSLVSFEGITKRGKLHDKSEGHINNDFLIDARRHLHIERENVTTPTSRHSCLLADTSLYITPMNFDSRYYIVISFWRSGSNRQSHQQWREHASKLGL